MKNLREEIYEAIRYSEVVEDDTASEIVDILEPVIKKWALKMVGEDAVTNVSGIDIGEAYEQGVNDTKEYIRTKIKESTK